jgi:hypothetical protein
MKVHSEVYKGLLAWTTAFFVVEPILLLVAGYSNNPIVVFHFLGNYLFYTVIFVKTMYIYKLLFKKSEYFPNKDITSKNITLFFTIFILVQLVIDTSWAFMLKYMTRYIPILRIFAPYDRSMGLDLIINYVTKGQAVLLLTFVTFLYTSDMEAISTILFSMFVILVLAMPKNAKFL